MVRTFKRRQYVPTYDRAFTLVEVLVVIAIIVSLSIISFLSLVAYQQRQVFEQFVADTHTTLLTARQQALFSYQASSFSVYVGTSSVEVSPGLSVAPGAAANVIIDVPETVTLTPSLSGGTTTISFGRLTGLPHATGTISFTDNRSGATSSIDVLVSGIIKS